MQTQLEAANAKVTQYETEAQERRAGEADALLEEYENLSEEAKGTLREILLADRAKGETLLSALPKKQKKAELPANDAKGANGEKTESASSAKSADKTPPSPKHDPTAQDAQVSDEERAQKISTRAREIVKESGNKIALTKAYQQAETELEQQK